MIKAKVNTDHGYVRIEFLDRATKELVEKTLQYVGVKIDGRGVKSTTSVYIPVE